MRALGQPRIYPKTLERLIGKGSCIESFRSCMRSIRQECYWVAAERRGNPLPSSCRLDVGVTYWSAPFWFRMLRIIWTVTLAIVLQCTMLLLVVTAELGPRYLTPLSWAWPKRQTRRCPAQGWLGLQASPCPTAFR